MLAGYVLWRDGELVDQVFKNIEGLDLRALRATLGETDRSLWLADDDGRAIDPYKLQMPVLPEHFSNSPYQLGPPVAA